MDLVKFVPILGRSQRVGSIGACYADGNVLVGTVEPGCAGSARCSTSNRIRTSWTFNYDRRGGRRTVVSWRTTCAVNSRSSGICSRKALHRG